MANAVKGTPLVEMRDISISFGGIKAVDHVTVDLHPGEVVGLLGHNGAGKSTLIKCLSGAYQADAGQILINGHEVQISNPRDARAQNIETIYQTLALADNLNAASNLFLGRELVSSRGFLDESAMESETRKILGRLNPNFKKFNVPVRAAPVGRHRPCRLFQRQDPDHGRADCRLGSARNPDGVGTDRGTQSAGSGDFPH
jgi:D-xylose transport system ATP-binding protein